MAQTKTAPSTATAAPKPASASGKRTTRLLAGVIVTPPDESRVQALKSYEAAIQLMQAGKYAKAKESFTKMLSSAPPDLAERIRMYISACLLQISKGTTTFESHEERYDYAISLLNEGHYEDAREHFKSILKENPSADYVFYGLAVLASITGDSHVCLEHLAEAFQRNPSHRIQARSDSDFQDMADDPRFTELLYPEA